MSEILTVKEVGELLKLNKETVLRKIREGKIKAKNIGGEKKPDYRIKIEWVNEYMDNN